MHDDSLSLLPRTDFTRREFVVTSLAAGFALAVQPVSAETITTDSKGLEAGEVKIPVPDGEIPAYRAMPAKGDRSRSSSWSRRSSASTSTSRTSAGGSPSWDISPSRPRCTPARGTCRSSKTSRRSSRLSSKVPDAQVMSDLDAAVAWAKKTGKADTAKLGITGFCWGGRIVWLYASTQPEPEGGRGLVRPARRSSR